LIQLKPEVLEKIKEDIRQMYGAAEDEAEVFRQALEARSKEILESIRKEVNSRLASFARIGKALLQIDPFEKTPTQKIKRKIQEKR